MNRIEEVFRRCKQDGRSALICYLTAGFPSIQASEELMLASINAGADILEIGVPFSDPVADGKIIQFASLKAIERGMVPERAFEVASWLRERVDVPLVLMGYYNPIFRMREDEYVRRAVESGVDGMIVPDLPLEESFGLEKETRRSDLSLIQLVGPTTSEVRMREIASHSSGFLYLISTLGTTGERERFSDDLERLISRAKRASPIPVGVGFGISTQRQVSDVNSLGADAVIVGSALVRKVIDGASASEMSEMIRDLKKGCKKKILE